jgi:photosystem II stability/assembly factor-like uncharacterized protein
MVFLLMFSPAGGAFAEDATVAPGQPAGNNPALKMLPAVTTTAATKAMMLGSARAGKRIVTVGDHGIVLLSDDDGKSFRQAKAVPVRSTLTSVCFVDDKAGWAVGHWGVILATADGGETWEVQRSDTAVDQPLFSVCFKDRNRGWAVGLWSLVLATRDGGKTWDKIKPPPPPGGGKGDRNLLGIFASGKGTLLIAAEQGTVLRSGDDGATWNYVTTGYKGSFWTGISLKNGMLLVGGLRGTIYQSVDDGRSWKAATSSAKESITCFAEVKGKVLAVGLDGIILERADNGRGFSGKQREDRTPFTTLVVAENGQPVAFSKAGVVKDFPDEKKK